MKNLFFSRSLSLIDNFLSYVSNNSTCILRYGFAAVFLYFGWTSFTDPSVFSSLVPLWVGEIINVNIFVKIHGLVEIILAVLLAFNIHGSRVALTMGIILLITTSQLSGPTFLRDLMLSITLIVLSSILRKEELS